MDNSQIILFVVGIVIGILLSLTVFSRNDRIGLIPSTNTHFDQKLSSGAILSIESPNVT